jgi:nucleotide-binding universal stress UspA family protein
MKAGVAIKDIVVFLDSSGASDARLDIAIDIARGHDSSLIGAYVPTEAILTRHPDEFARGSAMNAVVGREMTSEDADAVRVAHRFAELTSASGISAEWRPIAKYGTAADLVLRARYADLSIVGQFATNASGALWKPEDLLFAFGGPALVVPLNAPPSYRTGRNILVAWDSSREAKRAVADAMPFLKSAGRITILAVDPPDLSDTFGGPGAALARRFERHGVTATVLNVAARGRNVGSVILEQARRIEADLIVMGAYGHMRVIEMVFGGATRTVLAQMPVPVLMSH